MSFACAVFFSDKAVVFCDKDFSLWEKSFALLHFNSEKVGFLKLLCNKATRIHDKASIKCDNYCFLFLFPAKKSLIKKLHSSSNTPCTIFVLSEKGLQKTE